MSCKTLPETKRYDIFVRSNLTEVLLTNLLSKMNYYCSIRAYDGKRRVGNWSKPVHFVTKSEPPTMKPKMKSWIVEKRVSDNSRF